MSDNLEIEPNLFYDVVEETNNETDNPSEPEEVVNDEPEESKEPASEDAESADEQDDDKDKSEESESEDFLFTIDDQDINEETVLTWKQAFDDRKSMQAYYTRKSQEQAQTINDKVAEITEKELAEITALKSVLEDLVTGDEESLDDLLEYDTDKYKEERARREKRDKALAHAKKLTTKSTQVTESEATVVHDELIKMNSEWTNGDKLTDAYNDDIALLKDYIKDNGFTNEEYQKSFNAKSLDAIIKAAKYDKSLKAKEKTKAKLKPVIKSRKSKSKQKPESEKSLTDYFYN
jgi:Ni/Co efflux regulator RcnB